MICQVSRTQVISDMTILPQTAQFSPSVYPMMSGPDRRQRLTSSLSPPTANDNGGHHSIVCVLKRNSRPYHWPYSCPDLRAHCSDAWPDLDSIRFWPDPIHNSQYNPGTSSFAGIPSTLAMDDNISRCQESQHDSIGCISPCPRLARLTRAYLELPSLHLLPWRNSHYRDMSPI